MKEDSTVLVTSKMVRDANRRTKAEFNIEWVLVHPNPRIESIRIEKGCKAEIVGNVMSSPLRVSVNCCGSEIKLLVAPEFISIPKPKKRVSYPGYPRMGSQVTVKGADDKNYVGTVVLHRLADKANGWFCMAPSTPEGFCVWHVNDIVGGVS